jgi:Ca-activated chloride channel family protein
MNARQQQYAQLAKDRMAAAPTAKAASVVAADAKAVDLPAGGTLADLQIWIGVLLMLIAAAGAILAGWAGRREHSTALSEG